MGGKVEENRRMVYFCFRCGCADPRWCRHNCRRCIQLFNDWVVAEQGNYKV